MRWIVFIALPALAACGGAAEQNKAAAERPASLPPGQWELTSQVTAFQAVDQGRPKIDTPVGTRATESVCVGASRPPSALFAGAGYLCRYDTYYGRRGRVTAAMLCSREGLDGSIPITASGTFTADSLEYTRELRTSFAGDGDVAISSRVTGRRTGDCTPAAAEEPGNKAG